jgi:hypothetical protein
MSTKESNPKDTIGSGKAPLGLVSEAGILEMSLAMHEGAVKYGAHNFRSVGVRASVYVDAARRHIAKWVNGEERDPESQVHHLGSAMACLNIILDGQAMENLVDDRPPANPGLVRAIDAAAARVKHLTALHADKSPRHYRISDTQTRPPVAPIGPMLRPGTLIDVPDKDELARRVAEVRAARLADQEFRPEYGQIDKPAL